MDFLDFFVVVALLPSPPGARVQTTGDGRTTGVYYPPPSAIECISLPAYDKVRQARPRLRRGLSTAVPKGERMPNTTLLAIMRGRTYQAWHGMAWRGGAGAGRPKTSNNQALLGPWPGGFRPHPSRLRCDAKACRLRSLGPRPRTFLNLKSVLQVRKTGHSPSTRDPGLEMTASSP